MGALCGGLLGICLVLLDRWAPKAAKPYIPSAAGFGLAILPRYVARESLADGSVVPVLADHGLPAQEVHAGFPSPSKVTSFIAFLQESLAGEWWQRAA